MTMPLVQEIRYQWTDYSEHNKKDLTEVTFIEYIYPIKSEWIHVKVVRDDNDYCDWGYTLAFMITNVNGMIPYDRIKNKDAFLKYDNVTKLFKGQFRPNLPTFADFVWTFDNLSTTYGEISLRQLEASVRKRLTLYESIRKGDILTERDVLIRNKQEVSLETFTRALIFSNHGDYTLDELWSMERTILRKQFETCFSKGLLHNVIGEPYTQCGGTFFKLDFEEASFAVKTRKCMLYQGDVFLNASQAFSVVTSWLYKRPEFKIEPVENLKMIAGMIANTLTKEPIVIVKGDTPPCMEAMLKSLHIKSHGEKYLNNHARFGLVNFLIGSGTPVIKVKDMFIRRTRIVYDTDSEKKKHERESEVMISRAIKKNKDKPYGLGCAGLREWCPYKMDVFRAQQVCGCTNPFRYQAIEF